MIDATHHIRLVAGFEIRPSSGDCRFVLERDESERLGGHVADDLCHCVPEVTHGHLVTGPALLEPGQIISPGHAPWAAMARVAELDPDPGAPPAAGITSIGAQRGQLAHAPLVPYWSPPRGLLVCLPMLLAADRATRDTLHSRLEQVLFETGGMRPPAMATLADITGLDPVHGQLMTQADLMAMVKVQLAGAGLDPFWPPIEHALLAPRQGGRLELPGGLVAHWSVADSGWELEFVPFHAAACDAVAYALWLRAWRQTTAVLESHLVRWRADCSIDGIQIDHQNRWACCDLGAAEASSHGSIIQHPEVGVVAYTGVIESRRTAFYPLDPDALDELETELQKSGVEHFERTHTMDLLAAA